MADTTPGLTDVADAKATSESAEIARQNSHSPLGGQGVPAGVPLDEASAGDLAALGMDPDALPAPPIMDQPPDYRS